MKKAVSVTIASALMIVFAVSLSYLFYHFAKNEMMVLTSSANSTSYYHGYSATECSSFHPELLTFKYYAKNIDEYVDDFINLAGVDYYENLTYNESIHAFVVQNMSGSLPDFGDASFMVIYVFNPNNKNLYDYQVRVVIDTREMISNGNISSDCSDLRIVDKNNNLLNFWVWKESCNTSSTEIYFKAPYLPANYNETFYLLFGDGSNYSWGSYGDVFENSYANDEVRFYPLSVSTHSPYNGGNCLIFSNGSVVCRYDYASVYSTGDYFHESSKESFFIKQPPNFSTFVPLINVQQIYTTGVHLCIILNNGSVMCWGHNYYGQLGDGTTIDKVVGVFVKGGQQGTNILENVTQLSLGQLHSCALLTNGSVMCWGYNSYGRLGDGTSTDRYTPVFVKGGQQGTNILENVTQLSLGGSHSCALLSNGSVMCWGYNGYGQLGEGSYTSYYEPVFVKGGQQTTNILENVTQISAGFYHSCALLNNGSIMCWGYNNYGQLGNGSASYYEKALVPQFVKGGQQTTNILENVTQISCDYSHHSCALLNNGSVMCWGWNYYYQLGDGTSTNRDTPVFVKGGEQGTNILENVTNLSVMWYFSCALLSNGSVMCWGHNGYGQLGDGTTSSKSEPVFVKNDTNILQNITYFTAGNDKSCYVDNLSRGFCYGSGSYGSRGDLTSRPYATPRYILDPTYLEPLNMQLNISQVSLKPLCVLLNNGSIICSVNTYYMIYLSTVYDVFFDGLMKEISSTDSQPVISATEPKLFVLSLCALLHNGSLYCTGNYPGDGSSSNIERFVHVLDNVAQVSGYGSGYCALLNNGSVMCWGYNYYGTVGDGTTTTQYVPVFVKGGEQGTSILENVTQLSTGYYHVCTLLNNGSVMCWGKNSIGELGRGYYSSYDKSLVPVFVRNWDNSSILQNVTQISLGDRHSCALLNNGSLVCWGYNTYGQLGDGTTTSSSLPVFVKDVSGFENSSSNFTFVSAVGYSTAALLNSGYVAVWGYSSLGSITTPSLLYSFYDGELGSGVYANTNATLNKTRTLSTPYDASSDKYFYVSLRHDLYPEKVYSLGDYLAYYLQEGFLITKNLLSLNRSLVAAPYKLFFDVYEYPEGLRLELSYDNVSYWSVPLIGKMYEFNESFKGIQSLYLKIILRSNDIQTITPVLDSYRFVYYSYPESVAVLRFKNPSPYNITVVSYMIRNLDNSSALCLVNQTYYIAPSGVFYVRYPYDVCGDFSCDYGDDLEIVLNTECGPRKFEVKCK